MNFNKLAIMAVLATATSAAMGQVLGGRVFTYDGTTPTNGFATWIVNGDGPSANVFSGAYGGTGNSNAMTGATYTNAGFVAQTIINVSTYVYISGNFAATYNVQGIGTGTDSTQTQSIWINTNRALSFYASGFYGLYAGVGHIDYTMSLFQDYPSNGNLLSSTGGAQTDGNFNGREVQLSSPSQLPPDGKMTLQLTRQLTLNQAATGGQAYVASGTIQVAIN